MSACVQSERQVKELVLKKSQNEDKCIADGVGGQGAGGHRGPAWTDVDEGSQLSEQRC